MAMRTDQPTSTVLRGTFGTALARLAPLVAGAAIVLAACGSSSVAAGAASAPATIAASSAGPTPTATDASAAPASPAPSPIVAPSTVPEAALKTIWHNLGPNPGHTGNWQPVIDAQGRIWTAASVDGAFWIFDRDGKLVDTWNGRGMFHLEDKGAVAFGPNGDIYVADTGHARIVQFDKDRTPIRAWGTFGTDPGQFTSPMIVATDPAGHVYVIDERRNDIQEFGPDGTYLRTVATGMGPYLALDAAGDVYAVDEATVTLYKYPPAGGRIAVADLHNVITFATGIVIAPSGDIYLASSTSGGSDFDYEHVVQLDPSGKLVHLWPVGGEAMVLDPKGDRLYVTGYDRTYGVTAVAIPKP
jgi:NHL repeat